MGNNLSTGSLMESIVDSINSLIVKTYGGLVAFWVAIVYFGMMFLRFLGGCLAEGAISKGIEKIMPIVKSQFKQEFDSIRSEILELKEGVAIYKGQKHYIEGENLHLKEVIKTNDKEAMHELRKMWKENEKK